MVTLPRVGAGPLISSISSHPSGESLPVAARATSARARSEWDRAIDVWEDFQESGKDFSRDHVHGPALLKAVGPLRGQRVLDLGCGQGRFTRELARRGGRIVGVDWSTRMIEAAIRHERTTPRGIEYRVLDARTIGDAWPRHSFDVVVGCMSFMDMPDLPRVLRGVHAILRPRGRLVLSASHPFNTAEVGPDSLPPRPARGVRIDRYFEERVGVTRWAQKRLKRPFDTVFWHRPLEGWFRLLKSAGFEIHDLVEPHATPRQAREIPLLGLTRRVPYFLVLSCHRVARTRATRRRSVRTESHLPRSRRAGGRRGATR